MNTWPFTFTLGEFVREKRNHERYGQVVGPSDADGCWVVQFAHGGRVAPHEDGLETFTPTGADCLRVKHAFAAFNEALAKDQRERPHLYQ